MPRKILVVLFLVLFSANAALGGAYSGYTYDQLLTLKSNLETTAKNYKNQSNSYYSMAQYYRNSSSLSALSLYNQYMAMSIKYGNMAADAYGDLANIEKELSSRKKTVSSISITGSSTVAYCGTATYQCKAQYVGGKISTVTASWTVSNTAYGSFSGNRFTAKAAGAGKSVEITASFGGKTVKKKISLLPPPKLSGFAVSGSASVFVKTSFTFTAWAKYSDGTCTAVEPGWSSSNTAVATVSASGVVTGKKAGTATITAKYKENGIAKSVSMKITVVKKMTGLTVSGSASVAVKKSITLSVKANYNDGTSAAVKPGWSSSNTAVATVSTSGAVTGKKGGTVTVTAKYKENGITKSVSKKITVVRQMTGLTVSGSASVAAKKSITLTAKASYNDGTSAAVKPGWSSSNTAVATVSASGTVTGKKAGTVTITAKYKENGITKSVSKKITVVKQMTGLTISGASSLSFGQSTTLICYAQYSDGSKTKVAPSWSLIEIYNWPGKLSTITSSGVLTYKNISVNFQTTVIVRASYKGYSASKNVVLTNKTSGGGNNSSGGLSISGPSTLRFLATGNYYLYQNGKKVTSASVSWSRSGLCTMSDKGSYGLLKATSKPSGSTASVTVIATYNGKKATKKVTISR